MSNAYLSSKNILETSSGKWRSTLNEKEGFAGETLVRFFWRASLIEF